MLLVSKVALRLPGLAINFYCPYILDVGFFFYEGPLMRAWGFIRYPYPCHILPSMRQSLDMHVTPESFGL